MCAVGAGESTVGVRELRQNLSVYLRRAAKGEVFEVTEHGRPVAMLAPLPPGDALDRLIALGLARPAEGDLLDLGPPLDVPSESGLTITEALQQQRAERSWERR
jgi:prevent-host-death family protein